MITACWKDKVFCNMEGCRDTDCDRYISDADKKEASEYGITIEYAEYWRQCITYDEVKDAVKSENENENEK